MLLRRALLLALPFLALSSALPAAADDVTYEKLFFIQRSKNANEVHYDARVAKSGQLDEDEPVVGYWINKAEGGGRSSLTFLEKAAYGYDVEPASGGTYALSLEAFEDRPLTLRKDAKGAWRVAMKVAGKDAYLQKLYVATDESGFVPSVLHVDVFAVGTADGKPLQERLKKD
jgi:hypothetical protein